MTTEGADVEIDGARVLVAGGTGVIGRAVAAELHRRGARLVLAGRDPSKLAGAAGDLGGCPVVRFDAYDLDGCADAVAEAAAALGGLDAVLTAFGAAAFGPARGTGDDIAEHLMAVNALAPAAFLRAALPLLGEGGALAAVTGVVAERPQPGMADYSASKAALAAWLDAVRREVRPVGVRVLDLRFGHLDTGFADRAVAGEPPRMPPGGDLELSARTAVDALAAGAARVRPGPDGAPVVEDRAR
ncbi:SDR family oxidoreductase [Streptomyces sp. ODS05-4]|uniref:SDR family NAD(P)-dependent oxidoreductase n=1 Tax=Streptomyces sp. ODS05-4 TaxID=2944939 RepID=UPI00210B3C6C|nr:SDR family NAD(P)-dependent oxidoreductase [Streptomyces sp. ODS05-4]